MKKSIQIFLKGISAIVSFFLIFYILQPFFVPKYIGESTTIVKGFSFLEEGSIEVLFLGSSQMFCTIDAGKLTDKYGISSYDFGASSQTLPMTKFYYYEALKTQHPKLIMLEVCQIFSENTKVEDNSLSWNYDPIQPSFQKFSSLIQLCNNDLEKSFIYSFTPLFLYHDRWSSIGSKKYDGQYDIDYVIKPEEYIEPSNRGFLARDNVEPQIIEFNKNVSVRIIPQESKKAILDIVDDCRKQGIKLVLFKSPVASWTKGDSVSVKTFSDENQIPFLDLNERCKEIGINENLDFYNDAHLNVYGAEKTTDYIAKIINDYLPQQ